MALLGQPFDLSIRTSNKEPEWSSICNNVFDQYLDVDDPFGLGPEPRERSSSNDSANLFDFSTRSEQSHQTVGTSPIPSREDVDQSVRQGAEVSVIEARQPKVHKPMNFWTKTLRVLEHSAAISEKQQRLRTAKSHPDFLSLGRCPSPPILASSPADQSIPTQRRRSRHHNAANGRNVSRARSISRGRPSAAVGTLAGGVTKPTVNPFASVCKAGTSPNKMMTASRYSTLGSVAGFKDIWHRRAERSPKKYELQVPSRALPESPPPSATMPYSAPPPTQAHMHQDEDFAAFGSSPRFVHLAMPNSELVYNEDLSPLTATFGHTHIETPVASPLLIYATSDNVAAHPSNAWLNSGEVPPLPPVPPDACGLPMPNIPVADIAPLSNEHTSSVARQRIQSFDFGFSTSPNPYPSHATAPSAGPTAAGYSTTHQLFADPHAISTAILPSTEYVGLPQSELGITYHPSEFVVSPSTLLHQPSISCAVLPYHIPLLSGQHAVTMPNTPQHHHSVSRQRSLSPSPPPIGSARKARAISSSRSTRRSSRHRRTKSAGQHSSQRHPTSHHTSPEKGASGFVNFTPQDSSKILSGVAPSGSSKTKARREKEAADKRRRLSQAAVKAVVEAGGDLDKLAEAGLLVDTKGTA